MIAVKPQVAPEVVPTLAPHLGADTVVVSIMAGRTLGFLEQALPQAPRSCAPCRTRRPRSAAASPSRSPTSACRQRQRELAHALLAATGAVEWVDDEALMDAVTAVSGSGPAYVFLLAEALAQRRRRRRPAGRRSPTKLARETVAGSGELLHRSPLDAATLRQNVTSPGGTTAAALDVLMAPDGLDAADDQGGRGRDRALARTGGLNARRRAVALEPPPLSGLH